MARTAKNVLRPSPRSWWRAVRWPILAYVPAIVALSQIRRRIDFPRPVMIPLASAAPLAVAVALPRGRWRYAAVWAAYLWLFNIAHQIPFDQPDKLGRRLRVRESVRADSLITPVARAAGGHTARRCASPSPWLPAVPRSGLSPRRI